MPKSHIHKKKATISDLKRRIAQLKSSHTPPTSPLIGQQPPKTLSPSDILCGKYRKCGLTKTQIDNYNRNPSPQTLHSIFQKIRAKHPRLTLRTLTVELTITPITKPSATKKSNLHPTQIAEKTNILTIKLQQEQNELSRLIKNAKEKKQKETEAQQHFKKIVNAIKIHCSQDGKLNKKKLHELIVALTDNPDEQPPVAQHPSHNNAFSILADPEINLCYINMAFGTFPTFIAISQCALSNMCVKLQARSHLKIKPNLSLFSIITKSIAACCSFASLPLTLFFRQPQSRFQIHPATVFMLIGLAARKIFQPTQGNTNRAIMIILLINQTALFYSQLTQTHSADNTTTI